MGAWIEICLLLFLLEAQRLSHPTMGAWIEIVVLLFLLVSINCRTPRWVRGLKLAVVGAVLNAIVVAPHDGCVD